MLAADAKKIHVINVRRDKTKLACLLAFFFACTLACFNNTSNIGCGRENYGQNKACLLLLCLHVNCLSNTSGVNRIRKKYIHVNNARIDKTWPDDLEISLKGEQGGASSRARGAPSLWAYESWA